MTRRASPPAEALKAEPEAPGRTTAAGAADDADAGRQGFRRLLRQLRQTPWKFSFTAVMRRIGALHPAHPAIGLARRPRHEVFRLGQTAALSFAPREISDVVWAGEGLPLAAGSTPLKSGNNPALPVIRLYGLGMLGPQGPLPLHYTELVRERAENHHDTTLADFLDVFHHRYLTHFHRAWAQAQAAAGLDRPDDETFSRYVARLTGHDPLEIRDSVLPSHARLAASTHLSREARNPDGLVQTLARFFSVPVRLQEYVMHWIPLAAEDRSRLGQPSLSNVLGVGVIAGECVPDRQNKFRLVIGPLQLGQYERFTPHGVDLPKLVEWVRGFIGHEFLWEVELRVRRDSAPPARLGDRGRLGWSTWLGEAVAETPSPGVGDRAAPDHVVGMVFDPEAYAGQFSPAGASPG